MEIKFVVGKHLLIKISCRVKALLIEESKQIDTMRAVVNGATAG
jgi:hypothetical protein